MRLRKEVNTGTEPRMVEYNISFWDSEINAVIKELNEIKQEYQEKLKNKEGLG